MDQSADQPWPEVHIRATPESADDLEQWLFAAGAVSVSYRDEKDEPILEPAPGEFRLWDHIELIGLFTQDYTPERVHDSMMLAAAANGLVPTVYSLTMLGDQIWERAWMDSFKPMQFGPTLWVCPSHRPFVDETAINIKLDPGLAFGTGTHATTALCLKWLGSLSSDSLQSLAGKRIVDYGCGSGVLAIAAAMLGSTQLLAIDIDPQALQATRQNAVVNGVSDCIETAYDAPETHMCDLLMANILFQPLMQLADTFAHMVRPSGTIVMSGLLEEQIEPLRLRYNDVFEFEPDEVQDGWARLVAFRRTA